MPFQIARATTLSDCRERALRETQIVQDEGREALRVQRLVLLRECRKNFNRAVEKLTNECREEMRRIDAEVVKLTASGRESRDAFVEESEYVACVLEELNSAEIAERRAQEELEVRFRIPFVLSTIYA